MRADRWGDASSSPTPAPPLKGRGKRRKRQDGKNAHPVVFAEPAHGTSPAGFCELRQKRGPMVVRGKTASPLLPESGQLMEIRLHGAAPHSARSGSLRSRHVTPAPDGLRSLHSAARSTLRQHFAAPRWARHPPLFLRAPIRSPAPQQSAGSLEERARAGRTLDQLMEATRGRVDWIGLGGADRQRRNQRQRSPLRGVPPSEDSVRE